MKIIKCDRCGQVLEHHWEYSEVTIGKRVMVCKPEHADLCARCTKQLREFLHGAELKEEKSDDA